MPKLSPAIPDEVLLAAFGDRSRLSDELWITSHQLAMLMGRSIGQLDEDRKVGNPPSYMRPWGTRGPVRYRLGTVRDFMMGPYATECRNTREMAKHKAEIAMFSPKELNRAFGLPSPRKPPSKTSRR